MESKPTSSMQKVKIGAGVTLFVIVSAFVYLNLVRTPDSKYDEANKHVSSLITYASDFKTLGEGDVLNPSKVTTDQLNDAKTKAKAYSSALADLKNTAVISKDAQVAAAYKNAEKAVTDYSTSTTNMVVTVEALATIKRECNLLLDKAASITTFDELKAAGDGCDKALKKYTSVPLKEFNDDYFVPYHEQVKKLLDGVWTYYTAPTLSERTQADKDVVAAIAAIDELNTNTTAEIKNSDNPLESLNTLRAAINQSKQSLLR